MTTPTSNWQLTRFNLVLGDIHQMVHDHLDRLEHDQIVSRIWGRDHTVWKPEPHEIVNRLGWLDSPLEMLDRTEEIDAFVNAVMQDGFHSVLVLGMGGSSLAPAALGHIFAGSGLDLRVLDSTNPDAVLDTVNSLDLSRTLFVVSTKSGTTVETLSLFYRLFHWVSDDVGSDTAPRHFVVITDPDTPLYLTALDLELRAIFVNDPTIGGRFSVLTYFGLVPAALTGVRLNDLLDRAIEARQESMLMPMKNRAAILGTVLGASAIAGKDKLTLLISPEIAPLASWIEQLVAESTGKDNKGILPVIEDDLSDPSDYGNDRLFVIITLGNDPVNYDQIVSAGNPVIHMSLGDVYDLAEQFFIWEYATSVACHLLEVNTFDQPNVESAKVAARGLLSEHHEVGSLPTTVSETHGYGDLVDFLSNVSEGDYIAIQAYLAPSVELDLALVQLRRFLQQWSGLPTTVGYGPRFLHSTGQLHKGDRGNGHFIQLTCNPVEDVIIPESPSAIGENPATFGLLIASQSGGDLEALEAAGRRVAPLHLGDDPQAALKQIIDIFADAYVDQRASQNAT